MNLCILHNQYGTTYGTATKHTQPQLREGGGCSIIELMKTIAIIAEYNPYTKGHAHLLAEAKKVTGADRAIAVMSGNFLQRGASAMWDKFSRAKMAAQAGIDMVFELPVPYATGSARDFAEGAVALIDALGCVDYLCFGAEDPDIERFERLADTIANEPAEYSVLLKEHLSKGLSYPAAQATALSAHLNDESVIDLLSKPNNTLALSYITAIKIRGSHLTPFPIQRIGDYHDETAGDTYASATAIRTMITEAKNVTDEIAGYLPAETIDTLSRRLPKKTLFDASLPGEDLSYLIFTAKCYCGIYGLSYAMADRLDKTDAPMSYGEYVDVLHSKDTTEATARRALLHLMLGYTDEDRELFRARKDALFASLLAMRNEASDLMRKIKERSTIPIIDRRAHDTKQLTELPDELRPAAERAWELTIRATDLYRSIMFRRTKTLLASEYMTKIPHI